MRPTTNSIVWNQVSNSWDALQSTMNYTNNVDGVEAIQGKEEFELGPISNLNSFLGVVDDDSWILNNTTDVLGGVNNNNNGVNTMQDVGELTFGVDQNLLLQSMNSSSAASCSPSPASVYNNIATLSQVQNNYLMPPLPPIPQETSPIPALNPLPSSQFNFNSFNLGCENNLLQNFNGLGHAFGIGTGGFGDLSSQTQMGIPNLRQFSSAHLLQRTQNSGNPLFLNNNRSQLLQPLDQNVASIGPQPTLFQKRAAQRMNLTGNVANFGALGVQIGQNSRNEFVQVSGIINNNNSINGDHFEGSDFDGTNLDYDSDELTETINQPNISEENSNKEVTGEENKGRKRIKKGPPAKNLMAERRRREKLNDRLKMLRSVVPKISKMDRASILGDAIDYLKELRQKINDLQTELESPLPPQPPASSSTTLYPSTPTASALADRVRDNLSQTPNFAASQIASKPANIEVRTREGREVNIHMFCGRRPGLLLSTMRALDSLGLDIQQAVISCFNGFALDIFKAEQMKEGQDIPAEQIRAMLLDSAGFQGMV